MDENQMWYLWSMLVVTVCKKRPYENIVVFYRHKWWERTARKFWSCAHKISQKPIEYIRSSLYESLFW